MLIEYIHFSEPNRVKVYDTVKSRKNNYIKMTQEDWDKHELKKMEEDKNKGHIISYKII